MELIPNIVFSLILILSLGFFVRNIKRLRRNINFGKGQTETIEDSSQRWKNMIRIALGQSKMVRRPIAGILHIVVYLGFIIINIELIAVSYTHLTLPTKRIV